MDDRLSELFATHVETQRTRCAAALAQCGHDWLVLYSGRSRELFLDDRTSPFAANPMFRSWVPLPEHEGGALIIGADGTARLVYFKPQDYWHAPPAAPDARWTRHFELRIVSTPDEVVDATRKLQGKVALIADDTAPMELLAGVAHNPAALIARLHFARAVKTGYEVECMRRANAIAVRGHLAAAAAFREGASEFDIHVEYCRACGQDANDLPYDNIVALNEHGAILHYTERGTERGSHRSFLIDAGASYAGYAADITRTYAMDDGPFAELIERMEALQLAICSSARDGVDFVTLHADTHRRLAELLSATGLVRCSADASVEQGITRAFFPHGLGHYIGTQVHDVGGHQASADGARREPPEEHPFLRLTRTLEPGAVCTIEPGLYFIEMLLAGLRDRAAGKDVDWNRVDALVPFGGIRIEDDVHITADGHENLTRDQFAAAV